MLRDAPEAHDACREIVMSSDWALCLLIESTRYLASDGQVGSNPKVRFADYPGARGARLLSDIGPHRL